MALIWVEVQGKHARRRIDTTAQKRGETETHEWINGQQMDYGLKMITTMIVMMMIRW